MPYPRENLDKFRDEIEPSKHTHNKIRSWLASQGIIISKNAFSSRCVAWGSSCRTRIAASNPALVSVIDAAFHTTYYDDQTIADNIAK
jgi:hypothetical protein